MDIEPKIPTIEDFQSCLGSIFTVTVGETAVPLRLDDIEDLAPLEITGPDGKPIGHPNPFSLSFSGPKDLLMEQSTYAISHPGMGSLHLFIKPYHESENSYLYESIFN